MAGDFQLEMISKGAATRRSRCIQTTYACFSERSGFKAVLCVQILLESGPANLCFLFFCFILFFLFFSFLLFFFFLSFCSSNFLNLHFCYFCPSHLALLLGLLAPHISLSLLLGRKFTCHHYADGKGRVGRLAQIYVTMRGRILSVLFVLF